MSSPVRVLVVEDDSTLREVLQEVLTARGLDVVVASRGEEALQRAREESFDLIVADIRMDGINGLDTIEQARQLQPDIGSIVVSGFASEEETLRAVRLNVAGYLKKPFKVPDLLELINGFLVRRAERTRQEREQRELREALLWSLEQQGLWGERAVPGSVLRPARLAAGLAREMGLGPEMARQTFLGTLLERLTSLGGGEPGEATLSALSLYPHLRRLWTEELPSLERFAVEVGTSSEEWPSADGLTFPGADVEAAYRGFLSRPEDAGLEPEAVEESGGLLGLARALEQGGDLAGAGQAYRDLLGDGAPSAGGVAALLGLARLSLARGETPALEKAVADLLAMAEKLGPVTFAMAELEGAGVLRQAGHPATRKLYERASRSLGRVGLLVPWASAVLAVVGLEGEPPAGLEREPPAGLEREPPAGLERALEVLARPGHLSEVLERLAVLLPSLLELGTGAELTRRLVRDYPDEVATLLRRGQLSMAARRGLLEVLEAQGLAVPRSMLEVLQSDPDPETRARGVALHSKLGLAESLPLLRVFSMGPLEVSLGEERLDDRLWKTQKTKYLFARLAQSAPRPVSVERVLEEFWPDADVDSARKNLNTATSLIRKNLKPPGSNIDPVLRINDTMVLNPDLPLWHDVRELEQAATLGRRQLEAGNTEAAMASLSRVAQLYRGPYLEGCYLDWATQRQLTLENSVIDALQRLALHRRDQHRYREALEYALRLLLLQPDHEGAHEAAMTCYLGLEQHEKAVAHYESQRARLERELGVEPGMEMTRLYQMARYGFSHTPGFQAG